jgi:hypothetical protein
MLSDAIGYQGKACYVAFYWMECGDEMVYSDGRLSADGHWHAWLVFTQHKSIAPHLEGYNLGNSDEEATHWLLVDRETCAMYVGSPGEVIDVLREQYADQAAACEPQGAVIPDEITLEDFGSLIETFVEVRGPQPEEIIEAMRRRDRLTEELRLWLDEKPQQESSGLSKAEAASNFSMQWSAVSTLQIGCTSKLCLQQRAR